LSPLATLWEQHHQILAIGSIGCPLAEALNLTQLTSFHITELESNTTDTIISTHKWPTQAQDVFMTNLPILSPRDQPQFHWLGAMYPKTSPTSGSKDSQLMDWYRYILQTAATRREPCNLQAVILIGPLRIADTALKALFGKPGRIGNATPPLSVTPPMVGPWKPNIKSCASPPQESRNNGSSHKLLWRPLLGWTTSPMCNDPSDARNEQHNQRGTIEH
jgi:hypothetical protein